jgi:hypothetical protein
LTQRIADSFDMPEYILEPFLFMINSLKFAYEAPWLPKQSLGIKANTKHSSSIFAADNAARD